MILKRTQKFINSVNNENKILSVKSCLFNSKLSKEENQAVTD